MKMHDVFRYLPLGAVALAAASATPAAAQFPGDSRGAALINKLLGAGPRWASVSAFSVAGVVLGMSPEQARAALTKAGFAPRAEDPTQDAWSAVVSQRAAARIGGNVERAKVPMFTVAEGPQGERIEVWYAATQDGAKAAQVKYQIPTSRMERAVFAEGARAKYGRPTVEDASRALYCSKGEASCVAWQNKALPYMTVETSHSFHEIDLLMGARYGEELKARTAAAVEAAAPKNAKASF